MAEYTTWQECQAELLAELDEICRENGIDMFLCGETALCAYRDSSLSDRVSVCIDARRAYDLVRAIESHPDCGKRLAVESMLSNGSYPNLELRFCDLTTTDFNANNCDQYINNCIHITIKFIEHIPKLRVPFALSRMRFKNYRKDIKLPASTDNVAASSSLFRLMVKTASGKSSRVWINGHEQDLALFGEGRIVTVNGREYRVPGNGANYLKKEFGKFWKEHSCFVYEETNTCFRSCRMSWAEYREAISELDYARYKKAYKEERRITALFNKEHAKIRACYNVMERTFDRFYLFQKYMPMKAELLKLDEEGRKAELREELAEYIAFITKHYERGLGICFDEEILNIALKLLEEDKGKKYADAARALVPQDHLKPIRIKDYRGNYI